MARWHFKMLNDSARNLAFKRAIQYWIRKRGKVNVLDIGSGTGLLSMYAANVACVENIHAVECCEVMSKISAEVFKENVRGKLVKLITKHSKDLEVGEDLPSRPSLIVSETLDCGVFGEGILDTFIHAKQHLLEPDGKIVPWKVKIHVAGYKSTALTSNQFLINESFQEYIFLYNVKLVAKREEPYDAEYVEKISDFKLVTNVVDTLEVNFNDLESMQKHFDGSIVKDIQLQSEISNDYLDGFVVWFTLFLNEEDESNVISTAPNAGSCWPQAIFKMRRRVLLKKNQILKLFMSCKDGLLQINHDLDLMPEVDFLEVDAEVLKFLNDEEYLREIEFAVGKYKSSYTNCLDLSPFPYVGLMLLKDSRLEKLWCSKKHEEFVKKLAAKNVIGEDRFEFVNEYDFYEFSACFQLIILHPLTPLGDLDSQMLANYSKYQNVLTDDGLLVPLRVTLFGELINSDVLVDSSRVTDVQVKRLKIDKFINKFATEAHLDLDSSLDHEKLTSEFKIAEIHFDDQCHVENVTVRMRNINLPVHAIFFHYRIKLTASAIEFSTNRKSKTSCFKRTAQVLESDVNVGKAHVTVTVVQNSGIVKCDIVA